MLGDFGGELLDDLALLMLSLFGGDEGVFFLRVVRILMRGFAFFLGVAGRCVEGLVRGAVLLSDLWLLKGELTAFLDKLQYLLSHVLGLLAILSRSTLANIDAAAIEQNLLSPPSISIWLICYITYA